MQFAKMHGAGNDFIVVDARGLERDWSALARQVCDRHFGIGADGLILILPTQQHPPLVLSSQQADMRMRMFNPDGSEAEMCGNGIRCLAKFALEREIVPWPETALRVETLTGVLPVEPVCVEDGRVTRARVAMGVPRLSPREVPVDPTHRPAPGRWDILPL